MSAPIIILYDIPRRDEFSEKAWSPNVFKVRYALNIKGIPYTTVWKEYPEVEPICKELGIPPTGTKPDGSDFYTFPAIQDTRTKTFVGDSYAVIKYLDSAFPDTPPLIQPGSDALHAAFTQRVFRAVGFPIFKICAGRLSRQLNPPSEAYFKVAKAQQLGTDDFDSLNTAESFEALEKGLADIKSLLDANTDAKTVSVTGMPGTYTFSDVMLAAAANWLRTVAGEDSEDWKKAVALHDGFLGKFMENYKHFQQIV
ncbi:glutathione transferase GTE1 [Trametopsis cervina]|nr:glutathione transferase GTE1 [Trametopsis cervina]